MQANRNWFHRSAGLFLLGILCSQLPAPAATVYWDANATTPGAGASPAGTWTVDGFWGEDPNGEAATAAWIDGDDAVFSAGTDATTPFTVTLGADLSAVTVTVEEGSPTLIAASATTLSLAGKGNASSPWDPATVNLAAGAFLTIGDQVAVNLTGTVDHYLAGTGNLMIGGTAASLSSASTVPLLVINGPAVTVNAGGVVNHQHGTGTMVIGAGGTTSKLVVNGGAVHISGTGGLKLANNVGSSASAELNSGTITAAKVSKGSGTGTIYFDGGTLKASAASASFWGSSAANRGPTGYVKSGGALIDDDGKGTTGTPVTIWANLLEDETSTGGGLTKSGGGVVALYGASTYTGKTTVSGGTLVFDSIGDVGATSSALGAPTTVANGMIDLAGSLRYNGQAVSTTDRVINLTGGSIISQNGGTNSGLTLNGDITGSAALFLRGNRNMTVNGAISIGQANGLSKTDGGTVTLSNAANDFGQVLIAQGTLAVDSIADNGTASALGKGPESNSASIQLGQGSSATAGVLRFSGITSSSNRAIQLNNNATGTGNGNGAIENAAFGETLTLSGTVTAQHAGNAGLTLQGAGDGEISGEIGGAIGNISLVKAGGGAWTLSTANSYTGTTTVNGGTLVVDGSLAAASAVTVGGNSATGLPTLAGSGTINGSLTIAAAGTGAAGNVNPGGIDGSNDIATLTAGPTTIAGSYLCDLDATSADLLAVNGALVLSEGSILSCYELATPAAASYTIATYTGDPPSPFTNVENLPDGYQLDYATPGVIKLVQSAGNLTYEQWKTANAGGQGPELDFDSDGVENGIEWFMGIDTPGFTSHPAPDATKTVTWPKRGGYAGSYGSGYVIQTSPNLVDWTPVPAGDP
ncbi:MAG: autotransporter-associated beta strand repeat-containing protein, partial [Akkermansiaceae bacterium]|nr:autotransporter-associated beta strand repeat-containing protein [Akkermansiaceae bacterium]